MSILLHTILLSSIALYAVRSTRSPSVQDDGDRPVGVALVHRLPDRQEAELDIAEARAPDARESADQPDAAAAATGSVPPDFAEPIDLAGVLAELTAAADPTGAPGMGTGDIAGNASWLGPGEGEISRGDRGLKDATAGSTGAASLFGISASGSRFVYVVDRSDSMNSFDGRPWRAAKAELSRSVATLSASQSFQLVLYNDQPRPYRGAVPGGGLVQMLQGEPSLIAQIQRYVRAAEALGGTNHIDALRMALRMGPDVIFFLTDGHTPSLSDRELADIRRLAERNATTIHAIEFDAAPTPDPSSFVRHLASQNGGEYRYFDVRQFSNSGTWQPQPDQPQPEPLAPSAAP